jgi:hypothetical protein
MQLLFRTMNQDTHEPHPNQDYIAALLRDRLMPVRWDRSQKGVPFCMAA